jgi:hypothetical protein
MPCKYTKTYKTKFTDRYDQLNYIIDVIKQYHFNNKKVNWKSIKNRIKNTTLDSSNDIGIFLARHIFPLLKDNDHSNFKIKIKHKWYDKYHFNNALSLDYNDKSYKRKEYACVDPEKEFDYKPKYKILRKENILYIKAPRAFGEYFDYFVDIKDYLRNYENYDGIIYDLSECYGGSYAEIISPFYQVFGQTQIFSGISHHLDCSFTQILVRPNNPDDPWSYIKEIKYNKKDKLHDEHSYIFDSKIAIIVSSYTGSAGELATLFFTNRPNCKIFGEKTCGLTTLQSVNKICKDIELNMGVSYLIDRNKKHYNTDFFVTPDTNTKNPYDKAVQWILK